MRPEDNNTYEFGPFRIDAAERLLLRRGRRVPLTAKLFDILLLLVESRGQLVRKEELMERVWPESFVELNNLTVSISALRKALGGNKEEHYIETVSGRGYRFTAKVQRLENQTKSQSPVLATAIRSVAILPFKILSGGEENEYLGLGMADALITKLSNVHQMVVTPTTTVMRYVKSELEPLTIARKLGAATLLHGQIQKDDTHIRVTVQLISTRNEELLWGAKFDEKLTNIFMVQDSIAEQTVQALMLRITGRERELLAKHHTENSEALEAYQKGRYLWNKRTVHHIEKAMHYFQLATGIDAHCAAAYAGLADCYSVLNAHGIIPTGEFVSRVKELAHTALELDATLAEPHASLGYVKLFHDWDWPGAEKEFRRAIDLNPNYAIAHQWYAMYLMVIGQLEEALAELRRAQGLDPLSPIISTSLGGYFYYVRQWDRAIKQCRETLEIDPDFYLAVGILGAAYIQKGMYKEAIVELKKAVRLSKDPEVYATLGYAYAISDKRDEARKVLKNLSNLSKQKCMSPFGRSILCTCLGEVDKAFEFLERAYQDRNQWLVWLQLDPRLDVLRLDARFTDLLRRVDLTGHSDDQNEAIDSLAVLPLIPVGHDRNLEYLSEGISESIISNLSQLSLLKITARSTAFRYRDKEIDLVRIGQELGVRALFIGRLFQIRKKILIGVELIDTRDGSQIWGAQYDQTFSDIFMVQEEIAREISNQLQVKLSNTEKRALSRRYTESTEAYQLYLRGRYFLDRFSRSNVRKAIKYFQQAINLDQNYALAYTGLSGAYFRLSNSYLSPKSTLPKAHAAAQRAIEIDESLAEAHIAIAIIKTYYEYDWSGAEREFKRGIELNSGAAAGHQRYAAFLLLMKRFAEARKEIEVALSLDPLAMTINQTWGAYLNLTHQYDEAVEQYRKMLELDPNFYTAHFGLGWTYLHLGKFPDALNEFQKAFTLGRDYIALGYIGYIYAITGKKRQAAQVLKQLIETSQRTYISPYNMAVICIGLGDKEQAFNWLEELYKDRNEMITWLEIFPELDDLRSDPRFKDLLRRIGFLHSQ